MNHQDVTVKKELITPEWAREALSRQPDHQRHISQEIRDSYADDIRTGSWQCNGQSIIFDTVGILLDGQHRLSACEIAGKSFYSIVVKGVESQAFYTIDTGRARSIAQILHMEGHINTTALSATCNIIMHWHHKYLTRKRMSAPMALKLLKTYPQITESVKIGSRKPYEGRCLITQSAIAAFHFIAGYIDIDLRDEFIRTLILGFGTDGYDPDIHGEKFMGIDTLRKRMLNEIEVGKRSRNIHQLALVIEAWNSFYKNKPFNYFTYKFNYHLPSIEGLLDNALDIEN